MGSGKLITNGPDSWGLIIDALARRGKGEQVVFDTYEEISGGHRTSQIQVIITGLKWDWCVEPFHPHPDLSSREMEKLLGKSFNWENAWWFEGHSAGLASLPIWGFYDPQSKKGELLHQYIAPGEKFEKLNP